MGCALISAALDPGSARCALVIATDAPALALLSARVFEVGHLELLPEPEVTVTKAGKTRTKTHKRVHPADEIDALVSAIAGAIMGSGAGEVAIEMGAMYLAEGAPIKALRAQVREVGIAKDIATAIATRCKMAGIRVVNTRDANGVEHMGTPRITWLSALRRHVSAGLTPGLDPLPKTIGDGTCLDPLIRAHLPALYELPAHRASEDADEESDAPAGPVRARMPGADLRDAAGLLLSRVLVCPPPASKGATGEPRTRGTPREGGAPRKRTPAQLARMLADRREARAEKRAARGCTCREAEDGRASAGRCPRSCPAFRSKAETAVSAG